MIVLLIKQCILATGICTTHPVVGFLTETESKMGDTASATEICHTHRDPVRTALKKVNDPQSTIEADCEYRASVELPVLKKLYMGGCETNGKTCAGDYVALYYDKNFVNRCTQFITLNGEALKAQAALGGYTNVLRCDTP